jgi:hypothetical protein
VCSSDLEEFERTMVIRASLKPSPISAVKPVHPPGASVTQTNLSKLLEDEIQATGRYMSQPEPLPVLPSAAPHSAIPRKQAAVEAVSPVTSSPAMAKPSAASQLAAVQILSGANAGKELDLVKNLTTLGKPGEQVVVLTRRPQGFFITHVEGDQFPSVNGRVLGTQPRQLADHDIIELAGIKMEFYFKN